MSQVETALAVPCNGYSQRTLPVATSRHANFRSEVAMTGAEDELGCSIPVDVAGGNGAGGAVQWIFPAHLAGRDLETRKLPVLPAKSHQPLSVRSLRSEERRV